MTVRWLLVPLLVGACTHSEPFTNDVVLPGPRTSGANVQLTYNVDQDYWPIWTADGSAILYAFVDPDVPKHRCIGLLPPTGGTRIWQMCHNDATYDDSISSFTAYALAADGRLLYVEAVTPTVPGIPVGSQAAPFETTLWLADTAAPFRRTALLSLPANVNGSAVSWLGDLAWTGPNTFVALGQYYAIALHCFGVCIPPVPGGSLYDTVWSTGTIATASGIVVRGTIANGQATLTAVARTAGATGYSLAESGTSIVFTLRDDNRLYQVPASGGAVVTVGQATSPALPGNQLFGVSCLGTTCVVATDSATLTRLEPSHLFPMLNGGLRELRSISLVTGSSSTLASYQSVISAPQLSPRGDLVLQVGGLWGHLETYEGSEQSDLYLLIGVVH